MSEPSNRVKARTASLRRPIVGVESGTAVPVTARFDELAKRNFYNEITALRDEQRAQLVNAIVVVDGEDLPWELNRQGYMRWYMAPTMKDTALQTYIMYLQRIPPYSRSGKQHVPGHQLGFIWRGGPGYTVIDEVRHDWDNRDLLQIPQPPEGVVVQHFNPTDEPIDIMFCSLNSTHSNYVDRGPGFEQIEDCPEYARRDRSA